ncbi:hypothetical protein COT75_03265 [Candidatus Beckwithbacteria bacterium CG10_big_fil_rev_8_21_14_0_10_34_10]|uniref:ATP synthase epsilon chain n=1 Tax=Candidatus Beckwithbacteria bacterium CG10_big_fil_rev_8_21_14_0_10_34_10 TaxID=1974495 RepID=A0A2H0W8X6_9BACT|nr:MAG: hypothetical protein COT75_03265 [Candidatus Beckwithbacteria bacterium CG10_big_fil_rev_8_21_14_0_10_34_10]
MKKFYLEILKDNQVFFSSNKIKSLTAPSEEGQISILHGHAPLICQLKEGKIKIRFEDKTKAFYIQGTGFLYIEDNKTSLYVQKIGLLKNNHEKRWVKLSKTIKKQEKPPDLENKTLTKSLTAFIKKKYYFLKPRLFSKITENKTINLSLPKISLETIRNIKRTPPIKKENYKLHEFLWEKMIKVVSRFLKEIYDKI